MQKSEMRAGCDSLEALSFDADNPYQNLANAIIAVAADDYRVALKEENPGLKESVEKFFRSDWYKVLTNISGENLIDLLQREYAGALNAVHI